MSHTTKLETRLWKRVVLIHNGDWSGTTMLRAWTDDPETLSESFRQTPDFEATIEDGAVTQIKREVGGLGRERLLSLVLVVGRVMGVEKFRGAVVSHAEQFSP